MAWSEAARLAAIEARRRNKKPGGMPSRAEMQRQYQAMMNMSKFSPAREARERAKDRLARKSAGAKTKSTHLALLKKGYTRVQKQDSEGFRAYRSPSGKLVYQSSGKIIKAK